MNQSELEKRINLLEYHITLLTSCVDSDKYPLVSLILNMKWNEEQIDTAHDIFQKYDDLIQSKSEINWMEFEHELKTAFSIGYQTVKYIVVSFYKKNLWVDVCYHFAMSFEPTTPIEFHQITRHNKHLLS